ncbi:MAG: hypothetical protein AB7P23_12595, partial [Amphiplicatus sp.]
MRLRSVFRFLALFVCVIASPAWTQTIEIPQAPFRAAVDGNGVDVISRIVQSVEPEISIGSGSATLSHRRFTINPTYGPEGARHTNMYTITFPCPEGVCPDHLAQVVVSGPGKSRWFNRVGGVYVAQDPDGDSLTITDAAFTYTMRDGTVVIYDRTIIANGAYYYVPLLLGVATTIVRPDGATTHLIYRRTPYTYQGIQRYAVRLQSVTNNFGYQLKYSYKKDQISGVVDVDDWMQITYVTAIDNAVDYCDPTADGCAGLTKNWPKLDYAQSAPPYRYVMDPEGNATAYSNPGIDTFTVKRPGGSSDFMTLAYNLNDISLVTSIELEKDGLETTYSYEPYYVDVSNSFGTKRYSFTPHFPSDLIERVRDELGRETAYAYDSSARMTSETRPEGDKTLYSYDSRGNLTEIRQVSKTPGTPADSVIEMGYDATCVSIAKCNKPNWFRDANGHQTDFTYDNTTGQILTETRPAVDGVRPQTRYTYATRHAYFKNASGVIGPHGEAVSVLVSTSSCSSGASCAGTAAEELVETDYGPQSTGSPTHLLPLAVTLRAGDNSVSATTGYAYDDIGNKISEDGPLAGAADTIYFRYNLNRQVTGVIDPDPDGAGPLPHAATRTSYNADSQPSLVETGTVSGPSDAAWAAFAPQSKRTMTYDAAARLATEASAAAGGAAEEMRQYSYDARGLVDCVARRMNPAAYGSLPASACALGAEGAQGPDRVARNIYDAAGELLQVRKAVGTAIEIADVTYDYTANGKTQQAVDANGNRARLDYDGLDRLQKWTFPAPARASAFDPSTPASALATAGALNAGDYEQYGYDANGN